MIEDMEINAHLNFEMLLANLTARFINVDGDRVDAEIEAAQRLVCECLGLDLSALWQWDAKDPHTLFLSHLYRPLGGPPVPDRMNALHYFPWSQQQVLEGRTVALSSTENVVKEAFPDRESWRHYGIKTSLTIPLVAGIGVPFGAINFCDMRNKRVWDDELIKRLKLVAQVFSNAIFRKNVEQALRQSEARLAMAVDSAGAGLWSLNLETQCFWITDKIRELFGYDPDEVVDFDRFLGSVHPEDHAAVRRTVEEIVQKKQEGRVEYRIVDEDGSIRWMLSRGRLQSVNSDDRHCMVMGLTMDVTEHKDNEQRLHQALNEVEKLRDQLQMENVYLREQLKRDDGQDALVGESDPVLQMIAKARKVGPTDSTVLITGETGTGKELLAEAIHNLSKRKKRPMIKVNCAALPEPLIEGELFGREKGAYTGAMTQQHGRFEVADGSTIFLDEIGDLPLELQTKLLRVLQDGRFERLGSTRTISVDVRLVAATNHNLEEMVQNGTFRADLFHRLNVFPIEVPPLRAREADIPLLTWTFVQEFNVKMGRSIDSIPKQTIERLKTYYWPGNVRELRNIVERAMITSEGRSLKVDLPEAGRNTNARPATLEEVERNHIELVLDHARWRISGKGGAAEVLGLIPTTLHSRMKKLGISRPDYLNDSH